MDGCWWRGGGSKLHEYFFQADFFHLFWFVFVLYLNIHIFFSLSTGSQLIEISIEDTGNPPPWIIDYFLGGWGLGDYLYYY